MSSVSDETEELKMDDESKNTNSTPPDDVGEMFSEDKDEFDLETERWRYIKGEVIKMKLLVDKYPKFVKREGSAKIVLQLDAIFSAIENCPNPDLVDLAKIEGKLQEFKDNMLESFQQDLEKWKLQVRYSLHHVMERISFVLLIVMCLIFVWLLYDICYASPQS